MILRTSDAWETGSKPKTLTLPDVGRIRVHMMRSVVVFPAPLGPIRPKISPGLILKLSLSRARMAPNCLVSPSAFTARFIWVRPVRLIVLT